MITQEAYLSFFREYKDKTTKLQSKRISEDKAKFGTLLNSYGVFQRLINKLDNFEARGYNLFEIIKISHLEEKVHTPFIANLLDNKGSHAQQGLFYDAFLRMLVIEAPQLSSFNCLDHSYLEITAEKNAGKYGEIDILIHNTHPNERFAIIIENKIYAADQKEQLSRYYQYAINYLGLPLERILLVYLTPLGNEVSEGSIEAILSKKLTIEKSLLFISYKSHIRQWLSETLPLVKSIKVKQTIIQYLDNIKIICNE